MNELNSNSMLALYLLVDALDLSEDKKKLLGVWGDEKKGLIVPIVF